MRGIRQPMVIAEIAGRHPARARRCSAALAPDGLARAVPGRVARRCSRCWRRSGWSSSCSWSASSSTPGSCAARRARSRGDLARQHRRAVPARHRARALPLPAACADQRRAVHRVRPVHGRRDERHRVPGARAHPRRAPAHPARGSAPSRSPARPSTTSTAWCLLAFVVGGRARGRLGGAMLTTGLAPRLHRRDAARGPAAARAHRRRARHAGGDPQNVVAAALVLVLLSQLGDRAHRHPRALRRLPVRRHRAQATAASRRPWPQRLEDLVLVAPPAAVLRVQRPAHRDRPDRLGASEWLRLRPHHRWSPASASSAAARSRRG